MVRRRLFWLVAAVTGVAVACALGVFLYLGERDSREGQYATAPASVADYLVIQGTVQRVDAVNHEIVLRMLVNPVGALSEGGQDTLTPAAALVVESSSLSKGVLRYPAHERISLQDVSFSLDSGEVTDYPFDSYDAAIGFTAASGDQDVPVVVRIDDTDPFFISHARGLGMTGLTGFTLGFDRSLATMALAWFMIISMWALALSVLAAAWLLTSKKRGMVWPALGWMAATLFALAAFRNTAPGTPPFGCLLDYTAFLWAEAVIAVSVVLVVFRGIRHELAVEE